MNSSGDQGLECLSVVVGLRKIRLWAQTQDIASSECPGSRELNEGKNGDTHLFSKLQFCCHAKRKNSLDCLASF